MFGVLSTNLTFYTMTDAVVAHRASDPRVGVEHARVTKALGGTERKF